MKLYIDSVNNTKLGDIHFAVSEKGLRFLSFGKYSGLTDILEHACKYKLTTEKNPPKTKDVKNQLKEYLKGKRKTFTLKLDIGHLTSFQQKVLRNCYKIPAGKVVTYGSLAKKAGSARAARAAGQIMAANPIPLVIPCHRVVGSGGHLTGFAGGMNLKKKLLEMEGVQVKRNIVVQ